MTSPQSSPEFNIVHPESSATPEPSAPKASGSPTKASGTSKQTRRRRGVPIWVVLAVAIVGAGLFADQYQRAEQLTAQVGALETELAVADQKLSAYQTHLDVVRTSVGDLSKRVGSLNLLVNSDPLAPAADVTESSEVAPPSTFSDDATTSSAARVADAAVLSPALSAPITPDPSMSGDSVLDFPSDAALEIAPPDFGPLHPGERSSL